MTVVAPKIRPNVFRPPHQDNTVASPAPVPSSQPRPSHTWPSFLPPPLADTAAVTWLNKHKLLIN